MQKSSWPDDGKKSGNPGAVEPKRDAKDVEIENVCPFLGIAATVIARKSTAAEMLSGAPPETASLGGTLTSCVEHRCKFWRLETKTCLLRDALAEIVTSTFRRGLEKIVP